MWRSIQGISTLEELLLRHEKQGSDGRDAKLQPQVTTGTLAGRRPKLLPTSLLESDRHAIGRYEYQHADVPTQPNRAYNRDEQHPQDGWPAQSTPTSTKLERHRPPCGFRGCNRPPLPLLHLRRGIHDLLSHRLAGPLLFDSEEREPHPT